MCEAKVYGCGLHRQLKVECIISCSFDLMLMACISQSFLTTPLLSCAGLCYYSKQQQEVEAAAINATVEKSSVCHSHSPQTISMSVAIHSFSPAVPGNIY